jgi:hypothetical protein
MTADAYLIVHCNATDPSSSDGQCDSEGHWPVRVANHRELRRLLKAERGWRWTRDGRDLCPKHAEAES